MRVMRYITLLHWLNDYCDLVGHQIRHISENIEREKICVHKDKREREQFVEIITTTNQTNSFFIERVRNPEQVPPSQPVTLAQNSEIFVLNKHFEQCFLSVRGYLYLR
ncbi:hypothetical protein FGO68_gene16802 [Halteria grandinella]|uniref:Uncharacterized protein n=1 Tax=Halteria grandinella TaxID=5974 RepID=A0A8J8NIE5_HALGN|nr:hypothetical protein FGO68_gene16802 [Halteria grandinella]